MTLCHLMTKHGVSTGFCAAGLGSGASEEPLHPDIPGGTEEPNGGTGQGSAEPPRHAAEQHITQYKPIINCYEKRIAPCARGALVFH